MSITKRGGKKIDFTESIKKKWFTSSKNPILFHLEKSSKHANKQPQPFHITAAKTKCLLHIYANIN